MLLVVWVLKCIPKYNTDLKKLETEVYNLAVFWNVLHGQACFIPSHMFTLHFYRVLCVLNLFTWEVILMALTSSQLAHSMHIIQSPALKCDFGSVGKGFPLTAKVPCRLFKKLLLWGFFLNYFSYYLVIDPQLCRWIGEYGNL